MGRPSYRDHTGCWARQMAELGGSVIPVVLSPARTVGYGGFELAVEGWVTSINGNSNHWRLGTEGDPNAGADSCVDQDDPTRAISTGIGCNRFAPSTLFWSRLMARKAFPFGFQLGTGFSYLLGTNLFAWSLEVHWAIFEGFRTGVGGWFPDVAVRAAVNTLVGDSEFNMTVPSIDVIISKPIVLGSTARLTPFAAWQMAFIFADSELVDLTPGTDAFGECAPDPSQPGTVCTGSGFDYENNETYDSLRMNRQRLNFGLQFHYQLIQLTGSFAFDLIDPADMSDDAPSDIVDTSGNVISEGVGRQWTVAF
ncbi:MAG: hypothetical protein JRH11_20210, partial [Deltaproteobacteria bacterium]|nr:hypothetical protein [Deltaproteobacteria bacterium]